MHHLTLRYSDNFLTGPKATVKIVAVSRRPCAGFIGYISRSRCDEWIPPDFGRRPLRTHGTKEAWRLTFHFLLDEARHHRQLCPTELHSATLVSSTAPQPLTRSKLFTLQSLHMILNHFPIFVHSEPLRLVQTDPRVVPAPHESAGKIPATSGVLRPEPTFEAASNLTPTLPTRLPHISAGEQEFEEWEAGEVGGRKRGQGAAG